MQVIQEYRNKRHIVKVVRHDQSRPRNYSVLVNLRCIRWTPGHPNGLTTTLCQYHTDRPILMDDGTILFDKPELIPEYLIPTIQQAFKVRDTLIAMGPET